MKKKKLVAIAALAAAAFALLPMASASAAHSIGGYAKECIGSGNSAYNKVEVAVDGLGSDVPSRNYYAAARARVTATTGCAVRNGIKVIRVQIDRVALLGAGRTVVGAGPKNNGTSNVTLDTSGAHVSCYWNLQASVRFSVRYADGSSATGGSLTSGSFRRC